MKTLIVAGTGHRPEDCRHSETEIRIMARNKLRGSGATTFITGMAAGFDLWAGDEARLLGLEVWAAKPWTTHEPRKEDAELYATIIEYASKVVNVVESDTFPGAWCYHKRNEWMVDNADVVMSYWSGKESGGTYACREYARRTHKKLANIIGDPPF